MDLTKYVADKNPWASDEIVSQIVESIRDHLKERGISEEEHMKKLESIVDTRNELDKWMGVNKLIGESMPTITSDLRHLMSGADLKGLESMGDIIKVYRAMSRDELKRLRTTGEVEKQSWTTSLNVACFFTLHGATSRGKVVASMNILKSDVLAYVNERNEQEIILRLGDITTSKIKSLSKQVIAEGATRYTNKIRGIEAENKEVMVNARETMNKLVGAKYPILAEVA